MPFCRGSRICWSEAMGGGGALQNLVLPGTCHWYVVRVGGLCRVLPETELVGVVFRPGVLCGVFFADLFWGKINRSCFRFSEDRLSVFVSCRTEI